VFLSVKCLKNFKEGRNGIQFITLDQMTGKAKSWRVFNCISLSSLLTIFRIPEDHLDKYHSPPNLVPQSRDCVLEINSIGLRE